MAYRLTIKIFSTLLMLIIFTILAWKAWQGQYQITASLLTLGVVGCIIHIFYLVQNALRSFYDVLVSIEMDDFSQNFTFRNTLPLHLQKSLQEIFKKFQKVRLEKESQYLYLQSVVQHIPIGIFSISADATVDFYNNALLSILRCKAFKSLKDLPECYSPLLNALENKKNQKQLIRFLVEDEVLELVINVSEVQIAGRNHTIVSLQDFQAELADKEMEAWQNLTRILTHEIINSVTPIASLASTISENLAEEMEGMEDTRQAISVIEKRSQNLIQFVQEFRAFTKLPTPQPQAIALQEVFERLSTLISPDLEKNQIHFSYQITPENLYLFADLMMLEQILINLLKNAIQAVQSNEEKRIKLLAHTDHLGKVVIKVQDNGTGISDEAKKSIFVPFFTTKKTGSGIGLSLSRQMMRVQGGSISVYSVLGEGSTFTLRFP
jgi:nitrogen fixation/metabolism regulation signal transduction histidine kinase